MYVKCNMDDILNGPLMSKQTRWVLYDDHEESFITKVMSLMQSYGLFAHDHQLQDLTDYSKTVEALC